MEQSEKHTQHPDMFYKDGKPKKKFMLCYDREYIKELKKIYPNVAPGGIGVCGGLRCPLYAIGCGK